MTIQRLYSLPNCKLLLEGMSAEGPTGKADFSKVLSVLMNAECRFEGKGQPLSGGREFFESLVRAVSSYAQEFLSGVPSPLHQNGQAGSVQIRKIQDDLHRLTFQENTETAPEAQGKELLEKNIDLTTVQLFDLVEAVDQFFADPLTLPDLSLNLRPVSKREVASAEPVAKRALPAGIGISSFALAAIAFFLLPVPEVPPRTEPGLETETEVEIETEGSGSNLETPPISDPPEPITEPSPEDRSELSNPQTIPVANLEESLRATPRIQEQDKIEDLRQELFALINNNWTEPISNDLTYRVEVGEDGAIVGYKPINPKAAEDADRTPLPDLVYKGVDSQISKEPIAEFKVEFIRNNGTLQVSPW